METSPRLLELVQHLKENGNRLTPQRMAILALLAESRSHPSAEQIYEQVRAVFPMTSLATVYKTVALLKEAGEVLELAFAGSSSRYDGAAPQPHPHLICTQCQRIIDPEISGFDAVSDELAQKYGFQIVNHRVDFFGICPECQARQAAGSARVPQGSSSAGPRIG